MWNFIIVEGPKLQSMHPFLEELKQVDLLTLVSNTLCISPIFVQLMHTNYYKIVKQLKSFKIIIVVPTCFGLHKTSSGSSQPVLR